ncbi:hypothetical protein DFH05DRAFT_1461564 [Lentinula detonsa]|uniref:Uncharacterized protein n=1 Tax=Lentinula detonsa TaxID=2804962 RepID=A0A9W8NWU9_9AGAR|nr:hypothetical protein DFH05DRAFT_1461564 [Lentinula detonsa]
MNGFPFDVNNSPLPYPGSVDVSLGSGLDSQIFTGDNEFDFSSINYDEFDFSSINFDDPMLVDAFNSFSNLSPASGGVSALGHQNPPASTSNTPSNSILAPVLVPKTGFTSFEPTTHAQRNPLLPTQSICPHPKRTLDPVQARTMNEAKAEKQRLAMLARDDVLKLATVIYMPSYTMPSGLTSESIDNHIDIPIIRSIDRNDRIDRSIDHPITRSVSIPFSKLD